MAIVNVQAPPEELHLKSMNITNVGTTSWGRTKISCSPTAIIAVVPYAYNSSVGSNYAHSDILNNGTTGFEWYVDVASSQLCCIDRTGSNTTGATMFYIEQ